MEEGMETVKDFCKTIPNSSRQFREKVIHLTTVVKQDAPILPGVKYVIMKLGDVFLMLRDSGLQHSISDLLDVLLEKYCEPASISIVSVLNKIAKEFSIVSGRAPQAKLALLALKWVVKWLKFNSVNIKILESMSVFLAAIPDTSDTRRLRTIAWNLVFKLFSSQCNTLPGRCIDLILANYATTMPPLAIFVFVSLTLTYYSEQHKDLFPHKQYLEIIRLFTTCILAGRVMPHPLLISNCVGIFKEVTHSLFKEILLPAILKALKRNPDELTESITTIISCLPIDLSQYAEDIMKNVTSHSDSARGLIGAIAKQCSDVTVAKNLLKQFASSLKSTPTTSKL